MANTTPPTHPVADAWFTFTRTVLAPNLLDPANKLDPAASLAEHVAARREVAQRVADAAQQVLDACDATTDQRG